MLAVSPVRFLLKLPTPSVLRFSSCPQLAGVVPPSAVPQYICTVGFSPPVLTTLPLSVAVVAVILSAKDVLTVGEFITTSVVKFSLLAAHDDPPELDP